MQGFYFAVYDAALPQKLPTQQESPRLSPKQAVEGCHDCGTWFIPSHTSPPRPLAQVTYPLDERGVVLLRGSNLDDSGADSNGAGKTTLAMSALWALAGVVDTRHAHFRLLVP